MHPEFLKAGDAGTHVPAKFSLVCAKFWFLNAKPPKNTLSSWLLWFLLKQNKNALWFFLTFLCANLFDCIFVPAKQITFRMSVPSSPKYEIYLEHLGWLEKLVNMTLPCTTNVTFKIIFPASPLVVIILTTFLVTWGRWACCGPGQGWLLWSWWWAQTGQSSQSPGSRWQLLVSMQWQLYIYLYSKYVPSHWTI